MLFSSPEPSSKLFVPGLKPSIPRKRFEWEEEFDLAIAMQCRHQDSVSVSDPEPEVTYAADLERNERSLKQMQSLVCKYENHRSQVPEDLVYSSDSKSNSVFLKNRCHGSEKTELRSMDKILMPAHSLFSRVDFLEALPRMLEDEDCDTTYQGRTMGGEQQDLYF